MAEENRLDKLEKDFAQLQKSLTGIEKTLSSFTEKQVSQAQATAKNEAHQRINTAEHKAQALYQDVKASKCPCPYADEVAPCVKSPLSRAQR